MQFVAHAPFFFAGSGSTSFGACFFSSNAHSSFLFARRGLVQTDDWVARPITSLFRGLISADQEPNSYGVIAPYKTSVPCRTLPLIPRCPMKRQSAVWKQDKPDSTSCFSLNWLLIVLS